MTVFIYVPWCKYLSVLLSVLAEGEAFDARRWWNKWKVASETYYVLPYMESWYSVVSQCFIFLKVLYILFHTVIIRSPLIVVILICRLFIFRSWKLPEFYILRICCSGQYKLDFVKLCYMWIEVRQVFTQMTRSGSGYHLYQILVSEKLI